MNNELLVFTGTELLNKEGQAAYAKALVQKVEEDGRDILQTIIALASMSNIAEEAAKALDALCCDEIAKHGKSVTIHGVLLKLIEAGVSYDYSTDDRWCEINERFKQVKKEKDDWEKYLKTLRPGTIVTDKETGEVTAVAPVKSSRSTYSLTFPPKG
jgi:hypothetical protein